MKILVCTDGSENSQKCIEVASELASKCSVTGITIIHVYENVSLLPDYWQGNYPFSAEEEKQIEKMDKRIKSERQKFFTAAEKEFAKYNIEAKNIFKVGHPAEVIAQEAEEGQYDLIIIGRRGMSGIKKLFMGSISNAVLQLSNCNVLIVK